MASGLTVSEVRVCVSFRNVRVLCFDGQKLSGTFPLWFCVCTPENRESWCVLMNTWLHSLACLVYFQQTVQLGFSCCLDCAMYGPRNHKGDTALRLKPLNGAYLFDLNDRSPRWS